MNFEREITKLESELTDLKVVLSLAKILLDEKLPLDIWHTDGSLIIPANKRITVKHLKSVVKNRDFVQIDPSPIRNRIMAILQRD